MIDVITISRFTLFKRLLSKPYWTMTFIYVVLISLIINIPVIYSSFYANDIEKIGVFQSSALSQLEKQLPSKRISVRVYPDSIDSESIDQFVDDKLKANEVDGFLFQNSSQSSSKYNYLYNISPSSEVLKDLQTALEKLKQDRILNNISLSKDKALELVSPIELSINSINSLSFSNSKTLFYLSYGLFFMMFVMNSMYGNMLASEVAIEKSNRVMEIIVCSVSPIKQMCGKIIGLFTASMIQILIFICTVYINLNLPQNKSTFDVSISDIPISLFIYFILFFILCYLLFAMLYLCAGSLVSKTEELGQAIMPISLLLLGGFYLGISMFQAGDSAITSYATYFPFFSPFIIFARLATTSVSGWVISAVIAELVLAIIIMGYISHRIYSSGILIYGRKLSWKSAFKMIQRKPIK